jgi:YVTN family beta-propeller protein
MYRLLSRPRPGVAIACALTCLGLVSAVGADTASAGTVRAPNLGAALRTPIAYVLIGNGEGHDVYPINTGTNKVGKPINVGPFASQLVASKDGRFVYASTEYGVTVIRTATNKVSKHIRIAGGVGAMVPGPQGKTVYAAAANGIVPIFTSSNTPGKPFGGGQDVMAITPNGKWMFAFDFDASTVSKINLATRKRVAEINVGMNPVDIAFSPDSTMAYVASFATSGSFGGQVVPITIATARAGKPVAVGNDPTALTITPDGKTLLVADNVAGVYPITVSTMKVGPVIPAGDGPVFIAIPPHGKFAYVANEFDSVISTVNIATKKAGPSIPVGLGPRMIAFTPDGKKAYVPNVGISHVGPGYRVTPINTVKNTSSKGIFVALNPSYVAIAP